MFDQRYHGLRGLQFDITPSAWLGASIKSVYLTCSDLRLRGGSGVDLDAFEQRWLTHLLT